MRASKKEQRSKQARALSGRAGSEEDAMIDSFKQKVAAGKERQQVLNGYFVKSCDPKGLNCVNRFAPEWDEDFKMTPRNVTSYRFGLPLGASVVQVPWDPYNIPQNDIFPKANFVGANVVGFGANDRFVPLEFTAIHHERLVPPWKRADKEKEMQGRERAWEKSLPVTMATDYHKACPMNEETGVGCIFGDDGVDGVTEATYFSNGFGADHKADKLLNSGVNVDSWVIMNATRHSWDAKGIDHPPADVPEYKWEGMKEPEWSSENSAMRSQGWNPEGPENKRLMLGTVNAYNDQLGVSDEFKDASQYGEQLQLHHQREIEENDHFADWNSNSDKNKLLVFGTSHTLAGQRWDPEHHKFVHDGWTLWNNSVPAAEAVADYRGPGARPLKMVRTGDFIRDAVLNQGWQGANMVNGADNNLKRASGEEQAEAFAPQKLQDLGVNV